MTDKHVTIMAAVIGLISASLGATVAGWATYHFGVRQAVETDLSRTSLKADLQFVTQMNANNPEKYLAARDQMLIFGGALVIGDLARQNRAHARYRVSNKKLSDEESKTTCKCDTENTASIDAVKSSAQTYISMRMRYQDNKQTDVSIEDVVSASCPYMRECFLGCWISHLGVCPKK